MANVDRNVLRMAIYELGWCDELSSMQVGVALNEALQNAIEHGNLEVSTDARSGRLREYEALVERRRGEEPYCNRRVRVSATLDRTEARFVVEDEGPGFDASQLPDPRDQPRPRLGTVQVARVPARVRTVRTHRPQ